MWFNDSPQNSSPDAVKSFLNKYFSSWSGTISNQNITVVKNSTFTIRGIPYITENCTQIKFKIPNSSKTKTFTVEKYSFIINEDITLSLKDIGFKCNLYMEDFYKFEKTYAPSENVQIYAFEKKWPSGKTWPDTDKDLNEFLKENFGFNVIDGTADADYASKDDYGYCYQSGPGILLCFTLDDISVTSIIFYGENDARPRIIKKREDNSFALLDGSIVNFYFNKVVFQYSRPEDRLILLSTYKDVEEDPEESVQTTNKKNTNVSFDGYTLDVLNRMGGIINIPLYYTRYNEWSGYSINTIKNVSKKEDYYFIDKWKVDGEDYSNKPFWSMYPHLPRRIGVEKKSGTELTVSDNIITISDKKYAFNKDKDAIILVKRSPGTLDTSKANFLTLGNEGSDYYAREGAYGMTYYGIVGEHEFVLTASCPEPDVRWVSSYDKNNDTILEHFSVAKPINEDIFSWSEESLEFKITMDAKGIGTYGSSHYMNATFTSTFKVKNWWFFFDNDNKKLLSQDKPIKHTAEYHTEEEEERVPAAYNVSLTCFNTISSPFFKYSSSGSQGNFLHFTTLQENSELVTGHQENYQGANNNYYYPHNYYYKDDDGIYCWTKIGLYIDSYDRYDVLLWENMKEYLQSKYPKA